MSQDRSPYSRSKKIKLIIWAVIISLLATGGFFFRNYLRTQVHTVIEMALSKMAGGKVEFKMTSFGFTSLSLGKIQFSQKNESADFNLTIGKVDIDYSPWKILRGKASGVVVSNVHFEGELFENKKTSTKPQKSVPALLLGLPGKLGISSSFIKIKKGKELLEASLEKCSLAPTGALSRKFKCIAKINTKEIQSKIDIEMDLKFTGPESFEMGPISLKLDAKTEDKIFKISPNNTSKGLIKVDLKPFKLEWNYPLELNFTNPDIEFRGVLPRFSGKFDPEENLSLDLEFAESKVQNHSGELGRFFGPIKVSATNLSHPKNRSLSSTFKLNFTDIKLPENVKTHLKAQEVLLDGTLELKAQKLKSSGQLTIGNDGLGLPFQISKALDKKAYPLKISLINIKLNSIPKILNDTENYNIKKGTLTAKTNIDLNDKSVVSQININDLSGPIHGISIDNIDCRNCGFSYTTGHPYFNLNLAAKKITAGQSLEDTEMMISGGADQIDLRKGTFKLFGGTVAITPLKLFLKETRQGTGKIIIGQMDVGKLLNFAMKGKVEASGKLGGVIPIKFDKKTFMIDNATLTNETTGVIRYNSKNSALDMAKTPQTSILLTALQNYHYKKIQLKIKNDKNYQTSGIISLDGYNPDYMNGNAIKLNISLNFNMMSMILSNLYLFELPKKLEAVFLKQIEEGLK